VKLREGMLYPTVQAYIAHAAGQPRNKPVMTGAGAIIEILKTAGLLKEEAGELVAPFEEEPEPEVPPASADGPPPETPEAAETVVSATVGEAVVATPAGTPAGSFTGAPATVSIHVQVRCTANEIEDLAPRLKALLRELSSED
jgi:hypothetical protein